MNRPLIIATLGLAICTGQPALAQIKEHSSPVEKPKDDNFPTLQLHFSEPRFVRVILPDGSDRTVLYLRYRVTNNTSEKYHFIPLFELENSEPRVRQDRLSPNYRKGIARLEDPDGKIDFKDSASITQNPISPNQPGKPEVSTYGIAMWDDLKPDVERVIIFVTGLSAEISVDEHSVIRRKALRMEFKRQKDSWGLVEEPMWVGRAVEIAQPPPR